LVPPGAKFAPISRPKLEDEVYLVLAGNRADSERFLRLAATQSGTRILTNSYKPNQEQIKTFTMSHSPEQFVNAIHKMWIEQCEATERLRERFGLETALDYLVAEKLFNFVEISDENPQWAAELPAFIAEVRRLFTAPEIQEFLDYPKRSKRFGSRKIFARLRQVFQWQRRRPSRTKRVTHGAPVKRPPPVPPS